ncbi:hypothetical protein G5C51_05300 [Streptomyces sp. A7024]|uniref:Uncharacterized protein n=1 Tax=Streptomyces coryli TaxID=1128680 RepID=A0A6G4TU39_9ACTN|nr:hypothetical protein [Streptomyces coryli]NGN63323.1 hypothetical protein [Streptomyces coryli]
MSSLFIEYDDATGPLQLQLVLLRRMEDHHPDLVDDALHRLDVPRAVMREANRKWQGRLRAGGRRRPAGIKDYGALLGPAESVVPRALGDLQCEVHTWPVPLWPELRFEVTVAPGVGTALNAWLVRAPGAAGPELRTLDDLAPWAATVDEVARAFPPAKPMEGTADNRFRLAFSGPDKSGQQRRCTAEFAWGLLQRWEIA